MCSALQRTLLGFWKLWPPDRMKLRTPLCYLDQGDKGGAARAKMLSHPNGGTPSNSAHTSRTPGVRRRSVLDLPRCDVDHQLKAELEQRPHRKHNQAHSCKTAPIGAQSRQWVISGKQNPPSVPARPPQKSSRRIVILVEISSGTKTVPDRRSSTWPDERSPRC
jgi:hypothetical protein